MRRPELIAAAGGLGLLLLALPTSAAARSSVRGWTMEDLTRSDVATRRGIPNVPGPMEREAIARVVWSILVPLAGLVGRDRIHITSGYRGPELNEAVGGKSTSQHMIGEAVDIKVDGYSPVVLAGLMRSHGLDVDQCIAEPTWVHVSHGPRARREFLRLDAESGRFVPL